MSYSWMITFADVTDQVIKNLGDTYLSANPDSTINYYQLTANKYISFVGSYGIDVATINQLDRTVAAKVPHDLVIQWLITCFHMLVSKNLVGVNNDPVSDDKWVKKYHLYRDEFKAISLQCTYEVVISGLLQQNYTRSKNTFDIMV